MGGISEEIIQQVKLQADIVEVVQSYLPGLKRMGATWKACCPFHKEKTPSFTVNAARNSFKCFGCGKGGDVIAFVMEMEQLTFVDTIELLARKYGIFIPEPTYIRGNSGKKPQNKEDGINYGSRDRLCLLHEKLADFYRKNLVSHPDSPVSRYFLTRGIPNDIAEQFKIGAAPDAWDEAIQFARQQGFIDDELIESGVVSSKEENSTHIYDRFRNRLVFPIWNEQGRIVGFSARSIEKDPQGWKYVNSPESPIFRKGKILYALNFARKHITETDSVIICEGQLDTIAWHRAGIQNAVAPQGTAFTPEQAMVLKRYTHNIVLALDNDNAGDAAVLKDAAILLPLGFTIKVAAYQGAKDADETLKTAGPEALKQTLTNAIDFFEFALGKVSAGLDLSIPTGRSKAGIAMVEWIMKLDDPITQDQYVRWLAGKLDIPENVIVMEIESRKNKQPSAYTDRSTPSKNSRLSAHAEDPQIMHLLHSLFRLVSYRKKYAELAANNEMLALALKLDSPVAKAIESILLSTMNGEWSDNAVSSIVTELQKQGYSPDELSILYASPIVPETNPDFQEYAEGAISFDELAPDLQESLLVFEEMTYNTCMDKIIFNYLHKKMAEITKSINTPDITPQHRNELIIDFTNALNEIKKIQTKI